MAGETDTIEKLSELARSAEAQLSTANNQILLLEREKLDLQQQQQQASELASERPPVDQAQLQFQQQTQQTQQQSHSEERPRIERQEPGMRESFG